MGRRITPREHREVVRLAAMGYTHDHLARLFEVERHTIARHLKRERERRDELPEFTREDRELLDRLKNADRPEFTLENAELVDILGRMVWHFDCSNCGAKIYAFAHVAEQHGGCGQCHARWTVTWGPNGSASIKNVVEKPAVAPPPYRR